MVSCSVLMTVYNKEKPEYLQLALESIYDNQTRKPDEIVIVFDGKLTDELYKVLDDFRSGKEDIVFYYPQEVNKGLGEALRIGSLKCTKDYIIRMDSDDISDSTRFEKQLAYVEKHPEIDVLGADIAEFDTNPCNIMRYRVCPSKHKDIVKMGKKRCPMNHVTVCIKRSALEKAGGYETCLLVEDYYLWVRMIAAGCVLENIHETAVYVRAEEDFCKKRGAKIRIKGWYKLQKVMLNNNMINFVESLMNMVYIIGFTYCPGWVRNFAYSKFLRNDNSENRISSEHNTKIQA